MKKGKLLVNVEELVVLLDEIQINMLNSPQLKSGLYLKCNLWLFQRFSLLCLSLLYLRLKCNLWLLQ